MEGKNDEVKYISKFDHENMQMHYGMVNKRSMIMLISVCITCIVLVLTFSRDDLESPRTPATRAFSRFWRTRIQ